MSWVVKASFEGGDAIWYASSRTGSALSLDQDNAFGFEDKVEALAVAAALDRDGFRARVVRLVKRGAK